MRVALLVVAALLAAACASAPATDGPLMAVQSRGGLCMEGMCETTIYVERDGLVHTAAKPPNELGIVAANSMAQLEAMIATADFDEIRSHPFTGTCPTAFDGQEVVFEFQTPTGVERVESCQTNVDFSSPLFSAVLEAVGQYLPIAVEQPGGPEMPEPPPIPVQ